MGLSNNERLSNIWWGLTRLTEILRDIPEGVNPTLKQKGETLWHAFLGNRTNNSFWVLGGDAENKITQPKGAWSAAILFQCDEANHPPEIADNPNTPFDPFDPDQGGPLSISGLLLKAPHGQTLKAVYNVYGWTESVLYALRRYKDTFLDQFESLSQVLSDIQGLCYGIFVREPAFGKAYVLNQVLETLYGGRYTFFMDPLGQAFLKSNLHHYLSRPMFNDLEANLTAILGWDTELRYTKKNTNPNLKLKLALTISGHQFSYDHQFNELMGKLRDSGFKIWAPLKIHQPPKDPKVISVPALRAIFEANKKTHMEQEAKSYQKYNKSQEDANFALHGPVVFHWPSYKSPNE